MTDALRDAELLSQVIDEGFRGERPLEEALTTYERRRNEAVMPMYEMTCQLATPQPPPPEMQALLGALRGNQVEIDNFLAQSAEPSRSPISLPPKTWNGSSMRGLQ